MRMRILKWPGGKEKELQYILPNLPPVIKRYFEPFVGGGSVYLAIEAEKYYINDKCSELIALYQMIKDQNQDFLTALKNIDSAFQQLSETEKSAFYNHLRDLYNHKDTYHLSDEVHTAIYLFIREFAYASMFRYNAKGEFNVPYGGISYNKKSLKKRIAFYESETLRARMQRTVIHNEDFEQFLSRYQLSEDDFVFLDPPYDSEFSTYAKNTFTLDDHMRLARYLQNECAAKFMLIIKDTDRIRELYQSDKLYIQSFEKRYAVNFRNRNNQHARHLLITNYAVLESQYALELA